MVQERRLSWAGHTRRMVDTRMPKMVLFGNLVDGKKKRGGQKLNWFKCLKEDCRKRDCKKWIEDAKVRSKWKKIVVSPPYIK